MGNRRIIFIAMIASALFLFIRCSAPKAPPVTTTLVAERAPATKADWEQKWDKLVAEAKKEGQIFVITVPGPEAPAAIRPVFLAKYGINIQSTTMRSADAAQKLYMERKAGIYAWDMLIDGSSLTANDMYRDGFFEPIEPALILPEVRNPAAYWNDELPLNFNGHSISIQKYPSESLLINTDLVKVDEIKSYRDLLNPKWKGKILIDDPTTPGAGSKMMHYIYSQNIAGGADFIRELVKQEPAITRDRRLLTEWVSRGKYSISLTARADITVPFIQMGSPLKYITPAEGNYVTHGGYGAYFFSKQPHPNAARVFLNWLLTREAGEVWSRAAGVQSSKVDVSTEFLNPDLVRKSGMKYFDSDTIAFVMKRQEVDENVKAMFAPLFK